MPEITEETAITVCSVVARALECDEGSLDVADDEVVQLRVFAREARVDPKMLTPRGLWPRYCPGHVWVTFWVHPYAPGSVAGERRRCEHCQLIEVVS